MVWEGLMSVNVLREVQVKCVFFYMPPSQDEDMFYQGGHFGCLWVKLRFCGWNWVVNVFSLVCVGFFRVYSLKLIRTTSPRLRKNDANKYGTRLYTS